MNTAPGDMRFEDSLRNILQASENPNVEIRQQSVFAEFCLELGTSAESVAINQRRRPLFRLFNARSSRWDSAVAGFMGVAVLTLLFVGQQGAFAETIAAIQNATSLVCTTVITSDRPGFQEIRQTLYWTSPDKIRMDSGGENHILDETTWSEGSRITFWDRKNKTAWIAKNMPERAKPLQEYVFGVSTVEGLVRMFKGPWGKSEAVQQEGQDRIKFIVKEREIGPATIIYIDPATSLPTEIQAATPRYSDGKVTEWLMATYRYTWNTPIAPEKMLAQLPGGVSPRLIDGSKQAIPHPVIAGVGVGPIRLGMSAEEVASIWGEADEVLDNNHYNYFDHGVQLYITKSQGVTNISCHLDKAILGAFKTFSGWTPEGVGIGSTEQEVVSTLGQPSNRQIEKAPDAPPSSPSAVILEYNAGLTFQLQPGYGMGVEPHVLSMRVHRGK